MDTPLFVFEANQSKEQLQLILAVVGTLLLLAAFFYLKRRNVDTKKANLQKTGLMLIGFGLIISIGSIFGIGWRLTQLGDVAIYKDRVISSYGEVAYKDLKAVYLHTGHKSSRLAPSIKLDTTRLAYFEEKIGRAYVFSDEHYDARSIVRAVRPIMDSLIQQ